MISATRIARGLLAKPPGPWLVWPFGFGFRVLYGVPFTVPHVFEGVFGVLCLGLRVLGV